ncbi:MAG: endolytic transglycosylase MltG [Saprospiraceae bacterium]|nr:endolytic transglycosylase MltG [Saprospiraceae bacterium]MBK9728548.1 endolytic transglycosylase MltG [Saprospiraceae bacterium]
MRLNNFAFYGSAIALLSIGIFAYLSYCAAFNANVRSSSRMELYVYPNETDVAIGLKMDSILFDTSSFMHLAKIMKLTKLKPGRYLFKKDDHNFAIINKLRSGAQDAINVTINNVRDIYQLSGKLGAVMMLDSMAFVSLLTDSINLMTLNFTKENILSLFIPNTYQMYWTTSGDRFLQRMLQENKNFWLKENRLQKAAEKSLGASEIYTVASIVEKETINESEKGMIAGVYLNRLKTGMKLQADPTVVFAMGLTGIQRVLLQHLRTESPYNTYLVEGLPPGPIWMPSTATIDSVLNATNHDYIFFCAKPGYDGTHTFAKSLEGHLLNARAYRKWLDSQRIK